jgi:beta-glucanase (GH16 family)
MKEKIARLRAARGRPYISLLLICLLLAGCSALPSDPEIPEAPSPSPSSRRPNELPPWAVDYDGQPRSSEKATGFEYDYDSLTYELVWSDEFDYEGLPDPAKWNYDTGGHGWGNNELQFYTNDGNAWADGEKLIIEARAEQMGSREYTSARLVTRQKGDWLYGRIEVRAKLPKGLGTWPAIWMLPTDWEYGGWPGSGEIDIMEHVGYDEGRIHHSIHTDAFNHMIGTQKGSGGVTIPTATEEFHLYAIEWLPDRIHFFVDDRLIYTYDPSLYVPAVTYRHWPFDKRHHLLINIALGGDWGGARGFDSNMLPVVMEVDYVRVYQSPEITALTAG